VLGKICSLSRRNRGCQPRLSFLLVPPNQIASFMSLWTSQRFLNTTLEERPEIVPRHDSVQHKTRATGVSVQVSLFNEVCIYEYEFTCTWMNLVRPYTYPNARRLGLQDDNTSVCKIQPTQICASRAPCPRPSHTS
jgi:hypothetical protein